MHRLNAMGRTTDFFNSGQAQNDMLYLPKHHGIGRMMEKEMPGVRQATEGRNWLDQAAISLSALCVVHCVGSAIIITLLASAGGILLHPIIHEIGLAVAIALAALGLGRGFLAHGFVLPASIGGVGLGIMAVALMVPHGGSEAVCTIIGVALVALGHHLNGRALA